MMSPLLDVGSSGTGGSKKLYSITKTKITKSATSILFRDVDWNFQVRAKRFTMTSLKGRILVGPDVANCLWSRVQ